MNLTEQAAARAKMKAKDYKGTVGHGLVGSNCYSTNPNGPLPGAD